MDNDASAAALLKGWMFLLVVVEACFLITPPREYPKEFRIGPIYAGGNPKGALPPLCRRGGGVHRGGTPSKGSLPYAVFWLLFVRTKSNPGYGAGGPENVGARGRSPHKGPAGRPERPARQCDHAIFSLMWLSRSRASSRVLSCLAKWTRTMSLTPFSLKKEVPGTQATPTLWAISSQNSTSVWPFFM